MTEPKRACLLLIRSLSLAVLIAMIGGCSHWGASRPFDRASLEQTSRVAVLVFEGPEPYVYSARKNIGLLGLPGLWIANAMEKEARDSVEGTSRVATSDLLEQALMDRVGRSPIGLEAIGGSSIVPSEVLASLNDRETDLKEWQYRYFTPPTTYERDYGFLLAEGVRYVFEVNLTLWLESKGEGFTPKLFGFSRWLDLDEERVLSYHMVKVERLDRVRPWEAYAADDGALAIEEWHSMVPELARESVAYYFGSGR